MGKSSTEIMDRWEQVKSLPTLSEPALIRIAEVNAKRAEAIAAGTTALESELAFLNATRECGIVLEAAKSALSPDQWKLAQVEFQFTSQQVQGLLTFARRYPEPIVDAREAVRSLQDAQMALGLADFPAGHGPQQLHPINLPAVFTKHLTAILADLKNLQERAPIESWSHSMARQTWAVFEPKWTYLSQIAEQIKAKAEAQSNG